MRLHFTKLDGAGNDFVALDWREHPAMDDAELARVARALCDRHRGVGADGLLVLEEAPAGLPVHFAMRYINRDGSIGEMCGNGARCMAVFAWHRGAAPAAMRFRTDAGIHEAEIREGGARVSFPDIDALPLEHTLAGASQAGQKALFLRVGVPHAIRFVEDIDMIDVFQVGREIRHDPAFAPKGTNANFAEWTGEHLRVRTYERGCEEETLACGTGSVAAACCHLWRTGHRGAATVTVLPTGGVPLTIDAEATGTGFRAVRLGGHARMVFDGSCTLSPSGEVTR